MLLRAPTCIAISRKIGTKKTFCKAISRQVLHLKSQGRLCWEIWKLNAVNIPSRVAQQLQPFLFPKIMAASQKCFLSQGCPWQVKQPRGWGTAAEFGDSWGSGDAETQGFGQVFPPGEEGSPRNPLCSLKCHQAPGDKFWGEKGT